MHNTHLIDKEPPSKPQEFSIIEMSPMKIETSGPGISTTQQFAYNNSLKRLTSIPMEQLLPPDEVLSLRHEAQPLHHKTTSPFSKLIVNCHSMKFANKMIGFIRPDCKFSQKQHIIVNDKASSYTQRKSKINGNFLHSNPSNFDLQIRLKLRNIRQILERHFQTFYNYLPIIEPNHILKLQWDILLCLIRIYLIMWSPIIVSFPQLQQSHNPFFLISCIFLSIDIILRMFTIYFHKGLPVRDKTKLITNQLTPGLIIELASILFGILLSIGYSLSIWLYLLFYYQLLNILSLVNIVQYHLKPSRNVSSLIDLFKLIAMVLLIQHFCGCIWYML